MIEPAVSPPPTSLRERKKIETRLAIRRAALDLATEHGVENVTVEAISDAADVSARTFFNYFPSKEDALVTDADRIGDALRPRILARPVDESPLQTLRAVVTENDPFELVQAKRERALARQRLVLENPALMARQRAKFSRLERSVAEALAERYGLDPDTDLRPALLAGVASSVFTVAIRTWAAGDSVPLRELLESAFDQLEDVLLTSPCALTAHSAPSHHARIEPLQ